MTVAIDQLEKELHAAGIADAPSLAGEIDAAQRGRSPEDAWRHLSAQVLTPQQPFQVHLAAHRAVFGDWDDSRGPAPVWVPDPETAMSSNVASLIYDRGQADYTSLHRWSVEQRIDFWELMIGRLGIRFMNPFERLVEDPQDVETPNWLFGAQLNIADSGLTGKPDRAAVVYAGEDGAVRTMTLGELTSLANRVANGLAAMGYRPGDAISIDMPMTVESVAIYLGIVRAGCVVVSIADSFAATEIATRNHIAGAKGIFTQDVIRRGNKQIPLYERVIESGSPAAVVLPAGEELAVELRQGDTAWDEFLCQDDSAASVAREPNDFCNILFSSGTTGDPKAIPWTHATPIKCAADGWLHHDIQPGDVVAWPTNLGWMMGPWLIFASLINNATIALYDSAPNTRGFCKFVQDARVTMLGVVPSLVKAWRLNDMVTGLDWSAIRCFSSTGECSNAEDMFWLMSRAVGYRPVIEYCGGTEIGGGYITGTMVQPAAPATFTTPALGLDVVILNDRGEESETGELFLVPPSVGLSRSLLNRDHHEVYFQDVPRGPDGRVLRRHGDEMRRLAGGYFQALGRADDTMNLGGIKTSSAEIERVVNTLEGVRETAAVAVPPLGGGPDLLVIFTVVEPGSSLKTDATRKAMQEAIRDGLNPLFRVHEVRLVDALPRTASNKVLRRTLRDQYQQEQEQQKPAGDR